MTELKPWIEDGAPEGVARLLEAARVERASDESLNRTLAAAGVGGVTASTTGATAGSASASAVLETKASMLLGTAGALKWMVVGASLGAAAVATVTENRAPDPPVAASPGARPSARTLGVPSSLQFAAPTPAVLPESPRAETTSIASEPSKSATAPPPRVITPEKPRPDVQDDGPPAEMDSERLAEEIRAIDSANQALASGRTAQALAALDDYDRRYAERRFAPEALYLRMEALARSGRAVEARTIAKRLATMYPNSPQSTRARVVLSETIP
jgi:TolA-binding protein